MNRDQGYVLHSNYTELILSHHGLAVIHSCPGEVDAYSRNIALSVNSTLKSKCVFWRNHFLLCPYLGLHNTSITYT